MHTPYEDILKHPADFRVKFRFYTKEEGGRPMANGIRVSTTQNRMGTAKVIS
jgi:hypothetical protein